jgi:hypothetical protein
MDEKLEGTWMENCKKRGWKIGRKMDEKLGGIG